MSRNVDLNKPLSDEDREYLASRSRQLGRNNKKRTQFFDPCFREEEGSKQMCEFFSTSLKQ